MNNRSVQRREFHQESFADRHKRVTLYLEHDVYTQLMYRREQGRIKNQTHLINTVLREYFARLTP